jgi:predicted glycosyltransferase
VNAVRVFFYVQYLEGIGHLVRASRIVEALLAQGASVTLVMGGERVGGMSLPACEIVELPPLRASPESYSRLLRPDHMPVDASYEAGRRDALLSAYERASPDVLITEGYPMGRWAMEFELGPLLERASAGPTRRPLILASLRDILQVPKDPAKVERSVAICARYYDALLVHGDRRLVAVEESFPAIAPFLGRVHYTGLVAPPPPPAGELSVNGAFDVVVTGGGGAIAGTVLRAAIAAKPDTDLANARWLALAGPKMPDPAFAALHEYATAHGVRLERYHADLVHLMRHARLSLQRAGYNTVCDMLVAGCRAILVPDAEHGQREQPLRAERLAALGRAVVLDESHLDPPHMAAAIEAALAQDVAAVDLDLDGAHKSARIVMELASHAEPG